MRSAFALARFDRANESLPILLETLEKEGYVRTRAIDAIAAMGPQARRALPTLVDALHQIGRRDRTRLIRALGEFGPAAEPAAMALKEFIWFLSSYDDLIAAAEALWKINGSPLAHEVIDRLVDERRGMGFSSDAWRAYWNIAGRDEALALATRQLETENDAVAGRVVYALEQIGPEAVAAIPLLRKAAETRGPDFRWTVQRAILKIEASAASLEATR